MSSNSLDLKLDYVAVFGYSFVFAFGLYKLSDTYNNPLDLFGNILLLTGLGALIAYHARKIQTRDGARADVDNDVVQKRLRIVAHSCITVFFIMTLQHMSKAVYRFYDNFALAGHLFLLYAVITNQPQLLGVVLLAMYFVFATYRKTQVTGLNMESLNLLGRILLLIYFVTSSTVGVYDLVK